MSLHSVSVEWAQEKRGTNGTGLEVWLQGLHTLCKSIWHTVGAKQCFPAF